MWCHWGRNGDAAWGALVHYSRSYRYAINVMFWFTLACTSPLTYGDDSLDAHQTSKLDQYSYIRRAWRVVALAVDPCVGS